MVRQSSCHWTGDDDGMAGGDYVEVGDPAIEPRLFRLFGDADGNGIIDLIDFAAFRIAFNPGYSSIFDFDDSGTVDLSDFGQFCDGYGAMV